MTDKVTRLELLRVLSSDASKLFAARERCATIHHTTDIRASGDEVEVTVRQMIREKVPASHHVGHGHIVDATLASSPQFDVILSDISAPILFKTENGTEYFPYESVHAIGGIKSTYKNGHVQEFVEQIGEVKRDLKRDPTPKTYIGRVAHPSTPPKQTPLNFRVAGGPPSTPPRRTYLNFRVPHPSRL